MIGLQVMNESEIMEPYGVTHDSWTDFFFFLKFKLTAELTHLQFKD